MGFMICPDYRVAYKDYFLKKYGLKKYAYRWNGVYVNHTNGGQNENLRNIFNAITHRMDEIVSWIIVYSDNSGKDGVKIDLNGTDHQQNIEITTKYWNSLGRCYSIYPKGHLLEQSILMIDIATRIDALIYLGHPGQFMHRNSKTKVCVANRLR